MRSIIMILELWIDVNENWVVLGVRDDQWAQVFAPIDRSRWMMMLGQEIMPTFFMPNGLNLANHRAKYTLHARLLGRWRNGLCSPIFS